MSAAHEVGGIDADGALTSPSRQARLICGNSGRNSVGRRVAAPRSTSAPSFISSAASRCRAQRPISRGPELKNKGCRRRSC